ncbi:MAG TPA: ABC transporter transmembrane domain-containing protein [Stellaceae bacterium]|nr:ABC transporter transmembrane domain-containing protein [Stellaceae bacterium]
MSGGRIEDDERILPRHLYRYVAASWLHQIPLLALTVATFLLQVAPLELQRRVVNDVIKRRSFHAVIVLCGVYLGAVIVQGLIKLAMNVYRGWIGENAKRDLRRRLYPVLDGAAAGSRAEAQGTAVSMVVAEVEPVGAFVGSAVSEPLLQFGVLASVLAYIVHLNVWMATAALVLFVPQLIFVPLMQHAMNRRTGIRVWILRQIGSGVISRHDPGAGYSLEDAARIDRVLQLNLGILKFKFTMNFLMNLCSQLQVIAVLLIGGWLVLHSRIEIGAIVAFISGVKQLNDPWGDVVNYFRDANLSLVKYRLLTTAVDSFAGRSPAAIPYAPPPARGRRRRWLRGVSADAAGSRHMP